MNTPCLYRRSVATVLLLFSLMAGRFATGQASDFSFRHYTTDHGLSSDQTTCIFKDKQGYMWFGTVNGLNRFDGVEFTVYKRAKDGLPGNYIIDINQSPDGWLWISTHRGICRFHPQTEKFESLPLPNNTDERGDNDFVSGIVFDKQGYGWFSTPDHLYRIHLQTRQLTAYPAVSTDVHPLLMYLFTDSRGHLYGLRAGALYQFDTDTNQYTYLLGQDSQHRDSQLHVSSLYEDSRNQLWVTTIERGLFRYDTRQHNFVDEPDGNEPINEIAEDFLPGGQSFFWASRGGYGLATYHPEKHTYTNYSPDTRDALSHNAGSILRFYRDAQTGIVWMATSKGIQKADPFEIKFKRKIIPFQATAGQNDQVGVIRQNAKNPSLYWLGLSNSGLIQWDRDNNTFTSIRQHAALPNLDVYDLLQQPDGLLWMGSNNDLISWDPVTNLWKHHRDFFTTREAFQAVNTLHQDKAGRIWIGTTYDGVFVMNAKNNRIQAWTTGEVATVGNPVGVHTFQEDSLQRIWISTSRGVFRINPATRQTDKIQLHPLNKQILPSDRLQSSLYIDSQNRLWVSGIGFLAQADLNGQVKKIYTSENGLLADHIYAIQEDNTGMIWMTTDNLMHRLNIQTGQFLYFRKENGLFANSSENRLTKNAAGELFLGFTGSFNHFFPEQLRYSRTPPDAVVTEVKVDNLTKTVTGQEAIAIQPSENTLSIEFAGINYSLPERNQYAFRLEGFDEDWTFTDKRSTTYTNLSPGQYTFRVKAANHDGIWNQTGVALSIRVIPPFWQTWWFILAMVISVAAIVYAVYRYRINNLLKLEAIRNRIATDLHDDMGSTLSSIRIFSDVVQRQIAPVQPEAVPILQRISSSATGLSESMQDIIWTIQTRHDSLEDVVTRMREFGLKIAEARQIEFKMQVSDKFQSTRLDVEQRRNLYLIFKESINNAIKYSECTQLTILLELSGKHLYMSIADNGKGFNPATVRQGNGLQNLHKRATEIRGKLTIQSAPGAGTRIELHTKLTS